MESNQQSSDNTSSIYRHRFVSAASATVGYAVGLQAYREATKTTPILSLAKPIRDASVPSLGLHDDAPLRQEYDEVQRVMKPYETRVEALQDGPATAEEMSRLEATVDSMIGADSVPKKIRAGLRQAKENIEVFA